MSHTAAIVFRDGNTRFIEVKENELLMDASLRQGVNLPVDCREGVCATCRGQCESGEIELDYVDEEALTEKEIESGHILACQTRLKSSGSFYFDVDSTLCSVSSEQFKGSVRVFNQVSDAAALIEIQLEEEGGRLRYLPGQYARLQIPGTDQWRAYSFANYSAAEGYVRFLIRLLPSGVMSDYLRYRCRVGDEITFEAPMGAFYLREVERPLLMVAGGTGLSAFLGMLEDLVARGNCSQAIRLCYGVTQDMDLSELDRLDSFKEQLADFDYDVIVMKPSEHWQGKQGVVCDLFDKEYLQQPFDAYLCGPPPMIDATQTWLEVNQVADYQLYFEKFVSS